MHVIGHLKDGKVTARVCRTEFSARASNTLGMSLLHAAQMPVQKAKQFVLQNAAALPNALPIRAWLGKTHR